MEHIWEKQSATESALGALESEVWVLADSRYRSLEEKLHAMKEKTDWQFKEVGEKVHLESQILRHELMMEITKLHDSKS